MEPIHPNKVHYISAHAYFFYFILFLAGVTLDLVFQLKLFKNSIVMPIGLVFLVLAPILIFWAQKTSHDLRKIQEIKTEHFCRGPYCYTRIPTQWGLFLLMLGFGIIVNAFFVVVTTIISFLVSKFVFIKKQEEVLAKKYGAPYLEYKKAVKF